MVLKTSVLKSDPVRFLILPLNSCVTCAGWLTALNLRCLWKLFGFGCGFTSHKLCDLPRPQFLHLKNEDNKKLISFVCWGLPGALLVKCLACCLAGHIASA